MGYIKRFVASAFLAGALLLGGVGAKAGEQETQIYCRDTLAIRDIIQSVRDDDDTGDAIFHTYENLTDEGRCEDVLASELSYVGSPPSAETCEIVARFCIGWSKVRWHTSIRTYTGYSLSVVYELPESDVAAK